MKSFLRKSSRNFITFFSFVLITTLLLTSIIAAQERSTPSDHDMGDTKSVTDPGDSLKNPIENKELSELRGKTIFLNNCAQCHGTLGRGDGPAGASVTPKPDDLASDEIHKLSDGSLFLGITNGAHGVMIPWKFVLSDDQRWHLVDYIRHLRLISQTTNKQ